MALGEGNASPTKLFLSGYLAAFADGFTLPCYSEHRHGNRWLVAECSLEGDHRGTITGFEPFEGHSVQALSDELKLELSVGDPWVDVFRWDEKIYVGKAQAIFKALGSELEPLAAAAPISLLDLVLAANEDASEPARKAFESVQGQHGKRVADNWFSNVFLLEQAKLMVRRALQTSGSGDVLAHEMRGLRVERRGRDFRLALPEAIASRLNSERKLDAVLRAVNGLSEAIGSKVSIEPQNDAPAEYLSALDARAANARIAELEQLLHQDVVTGLLNKAGLNHEMVARLGRLRPDEKLALFWLDLDNFKAINDWLGHQPGDRLLAEVASRLKRAAPRDGVVARFGGDEFIVACTAPDRRAVEVMAQQIMESVSREMRIDDNGVEIGASMGIAILPDDAEDLEALLQSADLALYHSKVNGRKQANFFDPSMTHELVRRREIQTELRVALERNELSLFFQPIIDLETGHIRAFEALVRWFHPEKGELHPHEFIPVAEETGVIVMLDRWVMTQAAKAAAQWPEDITVAVNLSPLHIKAPGAALAILNALREAKVQPERLELEITESALLDNSENTQSFIAELAEAGVSFALDDFGTGFSSLGNLSRYPFTKIKVDRSLVSGLNQGKKGEAIIRAVSGMGATLGIMIIAEGIESIEQAQAVRDAGCTLGQGFYFSRPVPDHAAVQLLQKEREGHDCSSEVRLSRL